MSPEYFPVDISAAKEYGIEKWQKEFFWPVSDEEFAKLSNDITQLFKRQIETQPEEIGDLLLIQRPLLFEYNHFLHALKVAGEIVKAKKKLLYSEKSLWYKDIANNTFADTNVLNKGKVKHSPFKRFEIAVKDFFRCAIYDLIFMKPFSSEKREVYGSVKPIMKEYIKKAPYRFHFTSMKDWLREDTSYRVPKKMTDSISRFSKEMAEELKSIASNNGIGLLNNHLTYLEKLIEARLTDAAKMLYSAKNKIGKRRFHLLVSSAGDPFSRALYIAVRKEGGKITSFSHGGHIGLYDTPTLAFSEFALSDEFITYNKNSCKLFEKIKNIHPPIGQNDVKITSCESRQFLKIWQRNKNKPLPTRIRRVMLVGYPHNPWRKYNASTSLSLMQLDLELKIVDSLKKSGYEVIYKVHPDRISEVEGIFEGRTKVLKGYFQNCLDEADAYLFGLIRSTAFSVALCTNKPIIAFMMAAEPYQPFPEPMELLKKRCSIISTKFDERNHIVFDEKELLSILFKDPEQPNTEFIETYMFPEGVKKNEGKR